jgi:hypothetical protein
MKLVEVLKQAEEEGLPRASTCRELDSYCVFRVIAEKILGFNKYEFGTRFNEVVQWVADQQLSVHRLAELNNETQLTFAGMAEVLKQNPNVFRRTHGY